MSQSRPTIGQDGIDDVLDDWEDESTDVAENVVEKYGEPDGVTEQRLIWYDSGPWKRTEVHRHGVNHEFPDQHVDFVEQFIDYHVPPERADDIVSFDGSVTIKRTRGELSAECHGEPANFLAINLVHDILEGDKTVQEAREVYTEIYARKEAGDEPDYITDLQFEPPEGDQRDPDEQTLTEEHEETAREYVGPE